MKITEILLNIDQAISDLIIGENGALKRGLNERNISTHLAVYLAPLFVNYDVDAEYNGDIDKPNDRKALSIAKNRLIEIGYKPNKSNSYKLTPDIIIHRRGTNNHNLVVLEVKKDVSSQNDKMYDLIKLEHLTIDYLGNHYNYKLGMAITFGTGKATGNVTKKLFQDGIPKKFEALE